MKLTLLREPDAFGVGIPARDAAPVGAPHAAILGLGTVLPGTRQVFTIYPAAFAAFVCPTSSH